MGVMVSLCYFGWVSKDILSMAMLRHSFANNGVWQGHSTRSEYCCRREGNLHLLPAGLTGIWPKCLEHMHIVWKMVWHSSGLPS